jgi:hypothetical protein
LLIFVKFWLVGSKNISTDPNNKVFWCMNWWSDLGLLPPPPEHVFSKTS